MPDSSLSGKVVIIAGLVIFAFFLIDVGLIYVSIKNGETFDIKYIYGGAEAIAFAAAGFVFGTEVHRQQADNAEARADKEEKRVNIYKPKWEEVVAQAKNNKDRISRLHQAQAEDIKKEFDELADKIQNLNTSVQNDLNLLQ